MSRHTLTLDDTLYEYLLAHTLREHPAQAALREETARHPHGGMQISPEQGQFMALLVKLIGPVVLRCCLVRVHCGPVISPEGFQQVFGRAILAEHPRLALEADPDYPLAHFDLANLYDERGDRTKAAEHYQAALKISPNYADAHYNIALLYQGSNQPMKAVRHWTMYLKLDPASQWANVARRELAKLRSQAVHPGYRR